MICASCGCVFDGAAHHRVCHDCYAGIRTQRLIECGYRRGWREACEALAASVDDHALAERLAELWRDV